MRALSVLASVASVGALALTVGACGADDHTAAAAPEPAPSSGEAGADAPEVDPFCEAQATTIRAGVEAERAKQRVLHVAVGLTTARCGAQVFRADDPASDDVVTDDSLWRLGSVTKTYVSAAILNLAADGELSLDDTLDGFVPDFPGAAGITVRQLLNHTSGIFNYTTSTAFREAVRTDPWKTYTPEELLAFATAEDPYFEPGSGWEYSNTNYVLLGMILERVGGTSAGAVVRELALEKAGLSRTFLDGDEPLTGELAPGYEAQSDVTTRYHPSVAWTAGAMVATPLDAVKWVTALYGSDAVLSADSKRELSSVVLQSGGYGLGVTVIPASSTLGNGRGVGHGGSIFGYQTQAFWFEGSKIGLVSIVGDSRGDPNALSLAVLEALADE
jgi:D-alanyl-D-alanine carboxypeptidase